MPPSGDRRESGLAASPAREGRLVACGTPEQVAGVRESFTGQYLADALAPPHARAS